MAGATTCPECGKRVSAYAAGCDGCGADLEAHARRRRLEEANAPPPRGPSRTATTARSFVAGLGITRLEAAVILLALVLLWSLPALALLVIALAILHGVLESRWGWTALFSALAVAALVLAFSG